jgi:hypothetical protein
LRQLIAMHPIDDTVVIMSRTIGGKEWSAGVVRLSKLRKWIATRPDEAHVVIHVKRLHEQLGGGDNGDNS